SAVARKLHSTLWPTLLFADSSSTRGSDARVRAISGLALLGTILIPLAGVLTPLGLKDGPIIQSDYKRMSASFVADTSPIGRATPPRDRYTYGRVCGGFEWFPCPGNQTPNTTAIAPSILEAFTSTSQGPFNMQFRRYYLGVTGSGY